MENRIPVDTRLQAIEETLSKIQKDLRRSRQWAMFRVLFFNILPVVVVVILSIPVVQALRPAIEAIRSFVSSADGGVRVNSSTSLSAQECRTLCDRFVP